MSDFYSWEAHDQREYEAQMASEAQAQSQRAAELAELLLQVSGNYEAAKDALLKAAGMYSQAVADWPDGHADVP